MAGVIAIFAVVVAIMGSAATDGGKTIENLTECARFECSKD